MMYCVGARRDEVDWDALWKRRTKEMAKKYREENTERIREYTRKYNAEHREHRNEIVRRSQKKRRAEAVANGLCCQCCRGVPAPGRKSCPKCLEQARDRMKRKRISSI